MGVSLGGSGGMIHSPSLMAPLVRHDRTHDHDQTVVTVWSLEAWTHPQRLDRADVAWQRAMLKRAVRFADAVVVPTHAMAGELAEFAPLGGRIRVIAGAAPDGFSVPADAVGRARVLELPQRYIVVLGRPADPDGLAPALRAAARADLDVVVLCAQGHDLASVVAQAVAAGVAEGRIHSLVALDAPDRAAVLGGSVAVIAASAAPAFPWRALETLAVGAPLIAARTAQNEELFADGAYLLAPGDEDAFVEAVRRAAEDEVFGSRLRVLAADRARAFAWRDAAERVWQLHAEL
jgi:glycosyltransferase involved in cell wall biosynthesis